MEGISFIMEMTIFKAVTDEDHWLNTNDSLLLAIADWMTIVIYSRTEKWSVICLSQCP